MKKMMSFSFAVCAVAGLTACASSSPDVISRENAQIIKNGDRRAIVQAKASEILAAGDAVTIVTTGSKVRVTKNK
jgi:outer membrane lipoprotein SlyB